MEERHQSGFVNIFGPPNAGKSTLLNALLGERLAIVTPKVQTTRHRILGFLTEPDYQIIFSDTPGIIDPHYKLHNRMMQQVQSAVEDADLSLLLMDVTDKPERVAEILASLKIKSKRILLINKVDLLAKPKDLKQKVSAFEALIPSDKIIAVSALTGYNLDKIIPAILEFLPISPAFFPEDDLSDRSTRFFISEMVREQVYFLYKQEIPYHTAVIVQSFEELPRITRIKADIIVSRETQKLIILGTKGSKIKELGIQAREKIEQFLDKKVYLELFVKVRPNWRENDNYLREYGY